MGKLKIRFGFPGQLGDIIVTVVLLWPHKDKRTSAFIPYSAPCIERVYRACLVLPVRASLLQGCTFCCRQACIYSTLYQTLVCIVVVRPCGRATQ